MKHKMTWILVLAVTVAVVPLMARWQSGNNGRNMPCQCGEDGHKLVTLEGTVTEVVHSTDGKGRFADGVHLVIRSGEKDQEVHLGPREWLNEKKFSTRKGESIKVVAFMCSCGSNPALMAREIQQGDTSLRLRDKDGIALWSRSHEGRSTGMRRGGKGRKGCGGGCAGCGNKR